MSELLKSIFRNLKGIFVAMLRGVKEKTHDPVRELQLVKQEANQKIVEIQSKVADVIENRDAAKDGMEEQKSLAGEFKVKASKAKKEGDIQKAKQLLTIFLTYSKNIETFEKSIQNFEDLRLQLKEKHDNLELQVMTLDAHIASVSAMSDLAKLDISVSDPNSNVNIAGIREAIDSAENTVRGIERKANAQREANEMFDNNPNKTSATFTSEVDDLLESL